MTPKMAEKKELTHAEIWDDSTLLNSWDAALQEYKKYHSIQATGATVGSLPASTKEEGEVEMKDISPQQLVHSQESEDKPVAPTNEEEEEEEGEVVPEVKNHTPEPQLMSQASVEAGQKLPSPPPFPPSILAGENETLRNLMISWYFAGYYTGLYEGQQKQ
ncbi:hypothetical protein L211DRAFT_399523 [Terfezia boudieri ATCC MYA-4762]|uniref:Uncharacterized protein n=1 Tax=Terfezia boudieri ATCC MYA-4762 TaxID=1051890 RepID=A0A3N4M0C6_9PEZI|nr:hypothetical protein L211DRAFT_399523 [Terfezia boudieri ATCC MYA-4762]